MGLNCNGVAWWTRCETKNNWECIVDAFTIEFGIRTTASQFANSFTKLFNLTSQLRDSQIERVKSANVVQWHSWPAWKGNCYVVQQWLCFINIQWIWYFIRYTEALNVSVGIFDYIEIGLSKSIDVGIILHLGWNVKKIIVKSL